jgi:hypothetical protein
LLKHSRFLVFLYFLLVLVLEVLLLVWLDKLVLLNCVVFLVLTKLVDVFSLDDLSLLLMTHFF